MFTITFPAGSNIPHFFLKSSGGLKLEDKKIVLITPVSSHTEVLKPLQLNLSCGHSFAGILYVDRIPLHDSLKGFISCPSCKTLRG